MVKLIEKICEWCGKSFNGKATSKYCCRECCNSGLKKKKQEHVIKHICEWCGKTFIKRGRGDYRFCCQKCYGAYVKDKNSNKIVKRTCVICGKEFNVMKLLNGRYSEATTCSEECRQTLSNSSCMKKFGVTNASKSPIIQHKKDLTKLKNNTINTSQPENKIAKLLETKYKVIERQYKSKEYPFNCDFYIPELDLYIEYQGNWTHGNHPYNPFNKEDKILSIKWLNKSEFSSYFKCAFDTWTVRDPLKRKVAKENNLNWIEFFTLKEFDDRFNNI